MRHLINTACNQAWIAACEMIPTFRLNRQPPWAMTDQSDPSKLHFACLGLPFLPYASDASPLCLDNGLSIGPRRSRPPYQDGRLAHH